MAVARGAALRGGNLGARPIAGRFRNMKGVSKRGQRPHPAICAFQRGPGSSQGRVLVVFYLTRRLAWCGNPFLCGFVSLIQGCPAKTPPVLLIIPTGRLEATADADGDIGRSSQLDHSKEPDLYFPELYWSSFIGSFQKKTLHKQNGLSKKKCLCVFAREKHQRTQIGFSSKSCH